MAKSFFEELCGTCHEENGYLKEHKRVTYINLLTSGRLNIYLVDIDKQTQERFERLIEQMKQAQGIAEQLKILVYGYIEHRDQLIKGIEAGVLAVVLMVHDCTGRTVNNKSHLLLSHPAGLPRLFDGTPYIVKIKSSFISLNLHNII